MLATWTSTSTTQVARRSRGPAVGRGGRICGGTDGKFGTEGARAAIHGALAAGQGGCWASAADSYPFLVWHAGLERESVCNSKW